MHPILSSRRASLLSTLVVLYIYFLLSWTVACENNKLDNSAYRYPALNAEKKRAKGSI